MEEAPCEEIRREGKRGGEKEWKDENKKKDDEKKRRREDRKRRMRRIGGTNEFY